MKIDIKKRIKNRGLSQCIGLLLFYVMIAVMCAMAITAVDVSENGSADRFYANGRYEDIRPKMIYGWTQCTKETGTGIAEPQNTYYHSVNVMKGKWNYFSMENLSDLSMKGVIRSYSGKKLVSSQVIECSPGENTIRLSGKKINRLCLYFYEDPTKIRLRNLHVSEYEKKGAGADFVREVVLIGTGILLVLLILNLVFDLQRRLECLVEKLGNLYVKLLECLADYLPEIRLSMKKAHVARTGIFLVLLYWNFYVRNNGKKASLYPQGALIYIAAFLLLYMVSKAYMQGRQKINGRYMGMWALLCVFMCISDLLVSKTYCYTGYIFLLVYGTLFLLYRDRQLCLDIFRDMAYAVQTFFGLTLFWGLVAGDLYGVENGRISIGFTNANVCAGYMMLTIIVCIALLEDIEMRKKWSWLLRTAVMSAEISAAFYILWLTQSRWALIISILFGSIWLFRMWKRRGDKEHTRRRLAILGMILLLCVPVSMTVWKAVLHQMDPEIRQTMYGRYLPESPGLVEVQASESRFISTLKSGNLESFTSGRTGIWTTYIREMNLWGHKYLCKVAGEEISPHNLFLAYLFRYGLLTGICFIYFWITTVVRSVRCLIRERCSWFGLLQFGIITGYFVLALMDAFEHPWIYANWTFAYIGIGIFGIEQDDTIEQ